MPYRISKKFIISKFKSVNTTFTKSINEFSLEIFDNPKKYFFFENNQFFVLFCGYLYGKNKHCAVSLLRAFNKHNLKNLNGSFNGIIINKAKNELYIINYKYVFKPIYYYTDKDKLIVSSNT